MKVLAIMTVVCTLLNVITLLKCSLEIRKQFTNTEWKIIKEKNKNKGYEWYISLMFICCPIINLIFSIILGFTSNKCIEEVVDKHKKLLKVE